MHPGTIPADPPNPDKIPAERAAKYQKIISKSGLEGSPEPPESIRGTSGTRPSEENAKNQLADAKNQLQVFFWDRFHGILGPGRERKIDKNRVRD